MKKVIFIILIPLCLLIAILSTYMLINKTDKAKVNNSSWSSKLTSKSTSKSANKSTNKSTSKSSNDNSTSKSTDSNSDSASSSKANSFGVSFETDNVSSDDVQNEVKSKLNDLFANISSLDEKSNSYFQGDSIIPLKQKINIGYIANLDSIEVYETKSNYLKEVGFYITKSSISRLVICTYDINLKTFKLIEIK